MPTTIPNVLTNYQTPLGAAFKNLASALASRPTDMELQQQAGALQLQQAQAAEAQQKIQTEASQNAARSKLGGMIADPRLYDNTFRPDAMPAPPSTGAMGVESTPIAKAFQPDMGAILKTSLDAGYKPDDLGKMLLVGAANGGGMRSERTQNAQVGSGEAFNSTAQAFDLGEQNKIDTNAATNATSRQNNADTNAKDIKVEGMKESNSEKDDAAASLDPATLHYVAEQIRQGVPISQLIPGMGKTSAAQRAAAVKEAAAEDIAAGRTGTDAAIARQDYAGNTAGNRTLANREASIGTAVHALENVIPTVKANLDQVARTGVYPLDVILNAAQKGTNDPALARLAVGINDAVNLHARATNPNGMVTDAGRATGYQLLNQAQDSKYLGAALDQMLVSAQRELAAPGQTRDDVHAAQRGVLGGRGGASAPATPAPVEQWQRDPATGKLMKVGG